MKYTEEKFEKKVPFTPTDDWTKDLTESDFFAEKETLLEKIAPAINAVREFAGNAVLTILAHTVFRKQMKETEDALKAFFEEGL